MSSVAILNVRYESASRVSELKLIGLWERPVRYDRTHPVGPERLWEFSGLDRTLRLPRSIRCDWTRPVGLERLWELSRLDRTLSFLCPVVHIGRVRSQLSVVLVAATATLFEWDTWRSGGDRTQATERIRSPTECVRCT